MNVEDLFVNHNQAIELKELGFNEPCIARFIGKQFSTNTLSNWYRHNSGEIAPKMLSAPLKSQVFKWFRDNHLIGHSIECPFESYSGLRAKICGRELYEMYVTDEDQLSISDDEFFSLTYEEAESKAIDLLIKIVKLKNEKSSSK